MSALGLGDYGSSDEDEGVVAPQPPPPHPQPSIATTTRPGPDLAEASSSKTSQPFAKPVADGTLQARQAQPDAPPGPSLGPAPGPAAMPPDLAEGDDDLPQDDGAVPTSPYTADRLLVRNLTMPPVPNFDIPPSPPGSPPPTTTARFGRFLELKKKGVHFNERLSQSAALRNPGLLSKLMDFAGISTEDQYATSLPEAVAPRSNFPEWAYADNLVAAHKKIAKKREEERAKMHRDSVDFVPAKEMQKGGSSTGRKSRFGDVERRERRRSRSPR
ncbi:hypothetical protein MBLNU459_g8199t1 [Dothideomycetes sp. NU459]